MAIVAAIIGVVGSIVGAGIKADGARKDRLNLKTQAQAQMDALRSDRQSGLLSFITAENDKDAAVLRWVLILVAVIVIALIWYALKRKK